MTIDARIAEIRKRCDAASSGPWTYLEDDPSDGLVGAPIFCCSTRYLGTSPRIAVARTMEADQSVNDSNAAFIAHARQDVVWLLQQLEKGRIEPGTVHRGMGSDLVALCGEMRGISGADQVRLSYLDKQVTCIRCLQARVKELEGKKEDPRGGGAAGSQQR